VVVACVCLLFALIGVACFLFVLGGVYQAAMDRLLEEGEFPRKNKSKKSVKGAVSVIYWLVVTAVFLIVSQTGAAEPKNIWIIWAVAGVLYGAVAAAVNAFEHSK